MFEFVTKPFKHQLDTFNRIKDLPYWGLLWEQGTGKSGCLVNLIRYKKQFPVLIICPNSVTYNWKKEIAFHAKPAMAEASIILDGSKKERIIKLSDPKYKIFIINFEGLRVIAEELLGVKWGVIIVDEVHRCVHYNTRIDTDKGSLRIGDIVEKNIDCNIATWNFLTHVIEYKQIAHRYKNYVNEKQVEINYGKNKIRTTESHKIYSNGKWKKAIQVSSGENLLALQKEIYRESVQKPSSPHILFSKVRQFSKLSKDINKNERKQPNVQQRVFQQNDEKSNRKKVQKTRREWAYNCPTTDFAQFDETPDRISDTNHVQKGKWFPILLQSRFSDTRKENSNRARRESTWWREKKTIGYKKNEKARGVRVDSVKILELGGRQNPRSCNEKNYFFYDLAIEDNHNYFANNILVHNCKNPKAIQSKIVIELSKHSQCRYVATGTPILNSLTDIFTMYLFLDRGLTFGTNWYSFRNRYFKDVNAGFKSKSWYFPKYTLIQNCEKEVHEKMYKIADRRLKADCLDLPDKVYQTIEVDMNKEQAKRYDEIKTDLITFFADKVAVAQIALTKMLRLNQITSGFITADDGSIIDLGSAKRDALLDLIEGIFPAKVIIFAHFRYDHDKIAELLKKYNPIIIRGGVENKQELVDKFQTDPERKVLIAQQHSAGIGINLTAASYVVYYSSNYSLEDRSQSEDRAHRAGSEIHDKITIYDLVCKNTIDEVIIKALKTKSDLADMVLDSIISEAGVTPRLAKT